MSQFEKMTGLQREISTVLNNANKQRFPLDLAVMAVARVLRELLRKMPSGGRNMFVEQVIIPFLRNEPVDGDNKIISIN